MERREMLMAVAIPTLVAIVALYLAVDNIARAGPGGAPAASPGVPTVMSYQGRLADPATGEPVADGTYNMSFAIYDAASGGTLLWEEPAAGSIPVQVTGGLFTHLLGSSVPLDPSVFSGGAYLEVAVNGETLSPRQQIAAVAYALVAQTLDGQSLADLDDRFVNITGDDMTGDLRILDGAGEPGFRYSTSDAILRIGATGNEGDVRLFNSNNERVMDLDAEEFNGYAGLRIFDPVGRSVLVFDAGLPRLQLGATGNGGELRIVDEAGQGMFEYDADDSLLELGGIGNSGQIQIKDHLNWTVARLLGSLLTLGREGGSSGRIILRADAGGDSITLDGATGNVRYSGALIGAFPRPAYDSSFRNISPGQSIRLNHNIGGNPDDYVVDIQCKYPPTGGTIFGIGIDFNDTEHSGFYWESLTSTHILVGRGEDDMFCTQIRVRIWVIK